MVEFTKHRQFVWIGCLVVFCSLLSNGSASISATTDNLSRLQAQFSNVFSPPARVINTNEDYPIPEHLVQDVRHIIQAVPRNTLFQYMRSDHMKAFGALTRIFKAENSSDDLFKTAVLLRDHPGMNYKFWLTSFMAVSLRRKELRGLGRPSLLRLMPDSFINSKALEDQKYQASLPRDQQTCVTIDGSVGVDNGEENRLWYFREDLLTNAQHIYWHLGNPSQNWINETDTLLWIDRRGEMFYYFHHNILARYNAERLSNGFARTLPFVLEEGYVVPEGYDSHLLELNALYDWSARLPNTVLTNVTDLTELMELINSDVNSGNFIAKNGSLISANNIEGIEHLGNLVEAGKLTPNDERYTVEGLHNNGHLAISMLSDNNWEFQYPVMAAPMTAMRDPIFYRWHLLIDLMFDNHKTLLAPYTPAEGDYPLGWPGVEILDLSVQTLPTDGQAEMNPNELRTFFGKQSVNLTIAADIWPINDTQEYCITRLEHGQFEYQITIDRKAEVSSDQATVRIFMAPRFNETGYRFTMEEQRGLFFAMDSFLIKLNVGENVITRKSSESPLLIQWRLEDSNFTIPTEEEPHCGCGWPQHLLIPKGTSNGMIFDLFAMVTNGLEDIPPKSSDLEDAEDDVCSSSYLLCGIMDQKYPDARPMGYPFDRRPFNISTEAGGSRLVADLDEYVQAVGNMKATEVRIFHEE